MLNFWHSLVKFMLLMFAEFRIACALIVSQRLMWTMWPDWAIFERFWWKITLQNQPKCMVTFGQFWKTLLRSKKMLWPVFWQFLEKFGYFLFQHLVTLPVNPIYVRTLNRGKITGNNFQIKTLFYICRGEHLWRNVKLQKVKLLVCAKLFTS